MGQLDQFGVFDNWDSSYGTNGIWVYITEEMEIIAEATLFFAYSCSLSNKLIKFFPSTGAVEEILSGGVFSTSSYLGLNNNIWEVQKVKFSMGQKVI